MGCSEEFTDGIILKPGERLTKDNIEQITMKTLDEQIKQMDKEHNEKMRAKSGEMDEMDKTMEEEWHKAIEEGLYKAMKKEREETRKESEAQIQEMKKSLDNLIGELVDSMEKDELKYTAQRTDEGKTHSRTTLNQNNE
ncbi:hypothetical protein [Helicobacter bilis]|nr:hypothetical protein [Helicobacter bilis]MCI7411861.1 hypothetical protein [Helicobacter bilis]MDD7296761.1 hypothetical protein [Helicobacter bilis]MDY4399702.1 hypothetical protein [Helicobacter bilis]